MQRLRLFFIVSTLVPLAVAQAVSLEDIWRHAEFGEMAISPTGEYLAATVPSGDQIGVVIIDIREFPQLKPTANLRMEHNENATGLIWANNDRLVFTSTLQIGRLARPRYTGRFYAVNADGSRRQNLYGFRVGDVVGRWAEIIHPLPDDDRHVLIMEWAHDRERPMAYRMDIYRRDRVRRVAVSPLEQGGLAADRDGEVRFAYGMDDDGNQKFAWRKDRDSDWTRVENPFDGNITPWGTDENGDQVFISSRDQNNLGVYRVDLESGRYEKLLGDDTFAAIEPIWDSAGERLIGAIFATPIPEARFIEPEHPTARTWRSLAEALPGYDLRIFNFTKDGTRAITGIFNDREPGVFMLLDTESMALNELAAAREWIPVERMAEMKPIQFTARDGLELHGYLTLPPGSDGAGLPMIVEVHGGPHGPYDQWRFRSDVQSWALNGYAVLQINFRGSGGRSHQFEHDPYGQWGAEMQDDITDGTLWAIDEGIAHPDRVCISGGSYGGYAAMMGVVREPDLYRCAFAFVGVYDLELMKRRGDIPQSTFGRRYLDRALGTDTAVLRERSPVHHVDKIKADLFIAHGSEDIRAHYSHYHALIGALEKEGVPHEQLWVRGEGHGFYELENNVLLYGKALEFFDRSIGSGHTPREEALVRAALAQAAGESSAE